MKRYKLMAIAVPPVKPTGAIVDHWCFKHIEDSDGEWVKWGEHKGEIVRFTEIYEKRIRGLKAKIGQECNCTYYVDPHKQDAFVISWICPAHGYKRR